MKINRFLIFSIVAGVLITSCSGRDDKKVVENQDTKKSGITLTAQQIKNGGISFGQITTQVLSMDIHAKGKLALPPQNLAYVGTSMAGTVERILVQEGTYVAKGAALLVLISPELIRLQQDYLTSLSRYQVLEQNYARQQALSNDKITSEKQFQEVSADFSEIKSRVAAIEMQLELMNIPISKVKAGQIQKSATIIAPISGHVEKCMVHPGQYAEPNTPLMMLVDKNRLFIELMVFEKDVIYIETGQRVTFKLANLGSEEFEARVLNIGKTVEEGARTVKVLAEFENKASFILPGMFIAAEIHTSEQNLEALPEEAVVFDDNDTFCYYTLSGDGSESYSFMKIPLKTGFREDGFIQVEPLQPVPAGARIVVTGTYFVNAEGLKQNSEGE